MKPSRVTPPPPTPPRASALAGERGNLNESGQLMVVYLLAYSVCVPAFNTHLIAGGMSVVCVTQMILCVTSTAVVENRINLTYARRRQNRSTGREGRAAMMRFGGPSRRLLPPSGHSRSRASITCVTSVTSVTSVTAAPKCPLSFQPPPSRPQGVPHLLAAAAVEPSPTPNFKCDAPPNCGALRPLHCCVFHFP